MMNNFKEKIISGLSEGLYLLAKYGLIVFGLIFIINYIYNIKQMAENGNRAALAIYEYQQKNILPKFPIQNLKKENN